jgi:hypothetical protein
VARPCPPDDDAEYVAELDPCQLTVEVVDTDTSSDGDNRQHASASASVSDLCAAAAEVDRVVRAATAANPRILRGGGAELEPGPGAGAGAGTGAGAGAAAGAVIYGPRNPLVTGVVSNERLTNGGGSDVNHVVIDDTAGGLAYEAGDCVAVLPHGAPGQDPMGEGVAELLRRAGLAPDAMVRVAPASCRGY